jgi:hypothetical protein
MPNSDENVDGGESSQEVEERTRTVLDYSSSIDLKEALSEAFEGKRKDVVIPKPASEPEPRMNAVQVGCFGGVGCSPNAVSNINDVRTAEGIVQWQYLYLCFLYLPTILGILCLLDCI